MKTIGIILGIAAVGCVAYYFWWKRNRVREFYTSNVEIVDGILNFDDMVAYFKLNDLDKESDMPFIAKDGIKEQFRKEIHRHFPEGKEGYVTILLAVYNQKKDEIRHAKILYVKQVDDRIMDLFGDNELVVLS